MLPHTTQQSTQSVQFLSILHTRAHIIYSPKIKESQDYSIHMMTEDLYALKLANNIFNGGRCNEIMID